jgi:hypothetical protein
MCNILFILFVYFYLSMAVFILIFIEFISMYLFTVFILCVYFWIYLSFIFYLFTLLIYLLKCFLFYFISRKRLHFILFGSVKSSTGTRYGLDGSGIESRWDEMFCTCSGWPCDPSSLLYNRQLISFPAVKRAGVFADHLPTSSAEVKERAEVCLYSLSVVKFTFYIWRQVRSSHVCLG